jgi:hypothetical protein
MTVCLLQCMSQVLAHRVDSLRCRISEAIGAKRTCRERRERVDLTKMTHSCQSATDFAVMHNTALFNDVIGCGPRPDGA